MTLRLPAGVFTSATRLSNARALAEKLRQRELELLAQLPSVAEERAALLAQLREAGASELAHELEAEAAQG